METHNTGVTQRVNKQCAAAEWQGEKPIECLAGCTLVAGLGKGVAKGNQRKSSG